VNIRFTSSLTDTDENLVAPALLKAVVSILETLPIAYVIRIDTSDSQVFQHARPLVEQTSAKAGRELAAVRSAGSSVDHPRRL
jgi:hypothetical protein